MLCFSLPRQLTDTVPSLFILGQCDPVAWPCLGWRMYRSVSAHKLALEVRRGGHAAAYGPAGGSILEIPFAYGICAPCVMASGICCGSCSPLGAFEHPTGLAQDDSKYGAIGALALAWLQLHLRVDRPEDEGALTDHVRADLERKVLLRPAIASRFACQHATMERL